MSLLGCVSLLGRFVRVYACFVPTEPGDVDGRDSDSFSDVRNGGAGVWLVWIGT